MYLDYPKRFRDQGLHVLPEYNFEFCTIPKVGSTMWEHIFLKMLTHNKSAIHYKIEADRLWRYGEPRLDSNTVFSNPNSVRAVFVRDPLARFLSAFLDKCTSPKPAHPTISAVCNGSAIMKSVVAYVLGAQSQTEQDLDFHWWPQTTFCGTNNFVKEYSFIGLYKTETFGQDSACLMEVAGLQEYNTLGDLNNTPFWGSSQKDFRESTPNNIFKTTETTDTKSENELMKKIFTPQAARDLIEFYKIDYTTFKLPEPVWLIEGATGELYDFDFRAAM